jgi:hypothetical protein
MHKSSLSRRVRLSAIAAAAVFAILGGVSVAQGLIGHTTASDALKREKVVGTSLMTPAAILAKAGQVGLENIDTPSCSVAGQVIDTGARAHCFAEYMRIDALLATGGKTYAQMPRFASADGKGTNIEAQAEKLPNGVAMPNPARNVWITETALTTALNTSYMAEQLSLFGMAVGGAFLLIGIAFGVVGLTGMQRVSLRKRAVKPAQSAQSVVTA